MTSTGIFLISAVGIALGVLMGNRFAKCDHIAQYCWAIVGAIPGAALLVDKPEYMLLLLVVLPLLGLRSRSMGRRSSAT